MNSPISSRACSWPSNWIMKPGSGSCPSYDGSMWSEPAARELRLRSASMCRMSSYRLISQASIPAGQWTGVMGSSARSRV
ncbi:hypothetical protein ABZZ04_27965 [Streptomyces sp. NPDC006435]|uniref:hypothetical protein n=1 Tax=Streptomyces sp. NPDC006435 TaxID=3154300 RepID=UPI0033BB3DB5